jgi:hypothetical protein
MARGRDESGRFAERFDSEAFLRAVAALDVAGTADVAERVGCSYDLAYRRLGDLEAEGRVEKRTVGGAFVWLRADGDTADELEAPDEGPETA